MTGTDISPVFGLTLIELGELTAVTIGIGLASIITLLYIHHRQHGLQQKLVSAQLSMKMLKHLDENGHKKFTDPDALQPASEILENNTGVDGYLEIWEEIAVFREEGTITKTHMKKFFEVDLCTIRNGSVAYDHLKDKHTKTKYHNLWKLLEETCGPHST